MTDVDRSNFSIIIPQVIEQIRNCAFVSVDAEYTGLLATTPEIGNSLFDTPSKRYQKLKKGFCNFQISQFGISIFKKSWNFNEYSVESYNFYLYPVAFYTFKERHTFLCQVSSLNFLSANGFDFNRFIKTGAPYLRHDEIATLRTYIKNNRHFMTHLEHTDKKYFPRFIRELHDDDIEDIIDHLLGFSKVINEIQRSRKPVVGHNLFLDLLLIYQQFYGVLPDTYEEFKSELHKIFPIVFDTKNVAVGLRKFMIKNETKSMSDAEFLFNTTLLPLYKNIISIKNFFGPVINFQDGGLKYRSELESYLNIIEENDESNYSHYHEAGFDACVTGVIFVYLSHIAFRQSHRCLTSKVFATTTIELFGNLKWYENQINIVRATCNHINLNKADPLPTRPNWIRVESPTNSGGANLSLTWLQKQLPKYGDVEIFSETPASVLLACGGWGCAKKVWRFLETTGFKLTAVEHSTDLTPHHQRRFFCLSTIFKTIGSIGVFGVGAILLHFSVRKVRG